MLTDDVRVVVTLALAAIEMFCDAKRVPSTPSPE
jgi:hypothetical protein